VRPRCRPTSFPPCTCPMSCPDTRSLCWARNRLVDEGRGPLTQLRPPASEIDCGRRLVLALALGGAGFTQLAVSTLAEEVAAGDTDAPLRRQGDRLPVDPDWDGAGPEPRLPPPIFPITASAAGVEFRLALLDQPRSKPRSGAGAGGLVVRAVAALRSPPARNESVDSGFGSWRSCMGRGGASPSLRARPRAPRKTHKTWTSGGIRTAPNPCNSPLLHRGIRASG
jgi:hypothetical protein